MTKLKFISSSKVDLRHKVLYVLSQHSRKWRHGMRLLCKWRPSEFTSFCLKNQNFFALFLIVFSVRENMSGMRWHPLCVRRGAHSWTVCFVPTIKELMLIIWVNKLIVTELSEKLTWFLKVSTVFLSVRHTSLKANYFFIIKFVKSTLKPPCKFLHT